MLCKIAVNSSSNGKYREETINGRPHIITSMISIVCDSVMNNLFYGKPEVIASMGQLNRKLAPVGHPEAEGMHISAFDPLAINANNIGGFVLNPVSQGDKIVNELAIDIETAEKDDRGKEVLRRIKAGEKIGVSTGLNANIVNNAGEHEGKKYQGIVTNIQFDHVALLLDEPPAGDKTFTINSIQEVTICNVAESVRDLERMLCKALREKYKGDKTYSYLIDTMLNPDRAIAEITEGGGSCYAASIPFGYGDDGGIVFTGEPIKGHMKRVFQPDMPEKKTQVNKLNEQVNKKMNKESLVLAAIGNSLIAYNASDKDALMNMDEIGFINALTEKVTKPVTIESAQDVVEKAGFMVNAADEKELFNEFKKNKSAFMKFMKEKVAAKEKKVNHLIANSSMTAEDANGMTDEGLDRLIASISGTQDYSVQGAVVTNASNGGTVECDFTQ